MISLSSKFCFAAGGYYSDDVSNTIRTVYSEFDYGLGTYKSELMDTNDTNGVVTYALGLYASQEKRLGVEYKVETATTTFALNSSSLLTKWTSTAIRYRFWLIELGPVLGSVAATGVREGESIFNAVGSGYGGYFSFTLPVGKKSTLELKAMQVSTAETVDKTLAEVTFGPRTDLEISSRIAVSKKWFDATIGYRKRTNTITESGQTYNEGQTSTFLGLLAGFDF
jgi:hypothetical protein